MENFKEITAEQLAFGVSKEKFYYIIYYAIITGRERFLNLLKKQNPLFFNVYGEKMAEMDNSNLANFLGVMIKSWRISISLASVKDGAMLTSSNATPKAVEAEEILNNMKILNN